MFSIKLQALGLQLYWKRVPGTVVFLWILRNFYRTPPEDCFCILLYLKEQCTSYHDLLNFYSAIYSFFKNKVGQIIVRKIIGEKQSSRGIICQKGILRNFSKFTGKYLCQGLFFNKAAGLRSATLLKKRLWHRCFLVNLAKFLWIPFIIGHLWATASVKSDQRDIDFGNCLLIISGCNLWLKSDPLC